jgi:hypothetical protein
MRFFPAAAFLFAFASTASLLTAAADLRVVRVWPSYRTAESFSRISEYFGGGENTGKDTIVRSQPSSRAGYYFLTRIKNSGPALPDAKIELHVITPSSPEPKTFTFNAAIPAGSHVVQIGLTGNDWPNPKAQAVAWDLHVFGGVNGAELAHEQSYLWSQPDASAAAPAK